MNDALLGGAAVLIWNDVAAEAREQFYRWHDNEHIPERLALPGVRRGRRFISAGHSPEWLTMYEADAESKTRAFDVPSWVLLCECTKRDAAAKIRERIENGELARLNVSVRDDSAVYSLEMCRLFAAFNLRRHGKDHSGSSGAAH